MKYLYLCLFLLFATGCSREKTLSTFFPGLKWGKSLQNQKITLDKEFQEKKNSGIKIQFEGELSKHQLIAEVITDIDPDMAARLFKNKALMIRGIYSIQPQEETSCMRDLQIDPLPLDNKIQTSLLFNLKATERLVLGVCLEEQNVYRNQTLLLYCKKTNTFYDLRYYYPKSIKPILTPIVSCVN